MPNEHQGTTRRCRPGLAERRASDLRLLSGMRCAVFDCDAYLTTADLRLRRPAVTDPADGPMVTAYRWIFRIPTPISASQLMPVTEVGVDTGVPGYPSSPPLAWLLSVLVPWSPHFMRHAPVRACQQRWAEAGDIALGQFAIAIAHLLNWDDAGLCAGYLGWNTAAVLHRRSAYGNGPVNPAITYPALPARPR